jgi:hypothetical protein
MIAIMWKFEVRNDREDEFEQLYGVEGDWTKMNRATRSYLGTSFLRSETHRSEYLVIEYWSEMLVYEQQRIRTADALARLEQRRAALVASVEPLGVFTALDVPDRSGPAWSQRRSS